jgi:hypothetical protein
MKLRGRLLSFSRVKVHGQNDYKLISAGARDFSETDVTVQHFVFIGTSAAGQLICLTATTVLATNISFSTLRVLSRYCRD